jgi:hypothetical protein
MEGLFFRARFCFSAPVSRIADYLRFVAVRTAAQHYALVAVTGTAWLVKAEVLQRRYNIKVLPFPVSSTFAQVTEFLVRSLTRRRSARRRAEDGQRRRGSAAAATHPPEHRAAKELELEFRSLWKILLGDNGVGKSSILRAIAVAIVGSEARHTAGRLLKVGQTLGSVTLVTARNPSGYVTEIQRVGTGADVISRGGRRSKPRTGWRSAFRRCADRPEGAEGSAGRLDPRPTADDVMPLLAGEADNRSDDLKQWLVNTHAISRKEDADPLDRSRAQGIIERFFEIVRKVTGESPLELDDVTTDYRVMINTRDGKVPIEALSQGMTSLLGWVGIVLQRLYEVHYAKDATSDPTHQYALVLMDEIDAHMHPSWQQSLVGTLKELFRASRSSHRPTLRWLLAAFR